MSDSTPMMQQYARVKREHRDAILFFRLGDFYEMFRSDAEEASRLLGLTLTSRQGVPMCGVPHHAAHTYVGRLIKAGRKVAICEQTKLPPGGKGLAEREVVEIVTPGTATEEDFLDSASNNYLVSIASAGDTACLAYADLSTGELALASRPLSDISDFLRTTLARLTPREVLVQQSMLEEPAVEAVLGDGNNLLLNRYPDWQYDLKSSHDLLQDQLGVLNLKAFGIEPESVLPLAAGTLIEYLRDSVRGALPHIRSIIVEDDEDRLGLDDNTVRNLELVANMRDSSRRYTLLEVLDHSRTAMGARLLRKWILAPLRDVKGIELRQEQVRALYHAQSVLTELRERLGRVLDLERLASRVAMERAHAKELVAIRDSITQALEIHALLSEPTGDVLEFVRVVDDDLRAGLVELRSLLADSILDEPSTVLTEGRLIRSGYDADLDSLHRLRDNSRAVLEEYLEEERKATGISSLKVRYNRVIGHFLELSKTQAERAPGHFIRRQSLSNTERFTTERLAEIESSLNDAGERIIDLERELFLDVRNRVAQGIGLLLAVSHALATLDVLQALAYAATIHGYECPRVVDGVELGIADGRHPVVEAHLKSAAFVPNPTNLDVDGEYFALVTGPNMAGKSTYLRQVAHIVLMAHMGSFVPASDAVIGLTDRIFCRVGASDNLARGESTFLVEMNEAAYILRNASGRSLVIMDEIGRGTSTNDGLAIAQAVVEDLVGRVKCRTLFATHFHELSALDLPGLGNWSLKVMDEGAQIVFLKQLVEGPSSNSYGIHVAEVAGLPAEVVSRAREVLLSLAARERAPGDPPAQREVRTPVAELFNREELVAGEIRSLSVDELRPLEALQLIDRWKQELEETE